MHQFRHSNATTNRPFFGGFAEFESSNESGAILVTPDPIDWSDALNILSYKLHAKTHIDSWLQFARARGHRIKLEHLILVTGVDRTTSWATAVFSDTKLESGFGLKVQFATVGAPAGIDLACRYSWQSTSSAWVNTGPSPGRPDPMPAIAGPSMPREILLGRGAPDAATREIDKGDAERKPINTVKNQSLFIRHLRAKRRRPWRGLKMVAAGSDSDSDDSDDSSDEEGAGSAVDDIVVSSYPKTEKASRVNVFCWIIAD